MLLIFGGDALEEEDESGGILFAYPISTNDNQDTTHKQLMLAGVLRSILRHLYPARSKITERESLDSFEPFIRILSMHNHKFCSVELVCTNGEEITIAYSRPCPISDALLKQE